MAPRQLLARGSSIYRACAASAILQANCRQAGCDRSRSAPPCAARLAASPHVPAVLAGTPHVRVVVAEDTYPSANTDTLSGAEENALISAKRKAVAEVGVYIATSSQDNEMEVDGKTSWT